MGKKVTLTGKLWTTWSDADTLLFTKEDVSDLIFGMKFKNGTMKRLFNDLLNDIDCNTFGFNWIKITMENALTKKQQDKINKLREPKNPNMKYQIEWRKAQIVEDKDSLEKAMKYVKDIESSLEGHETELKVLQGEEE